MQGHLLCCKENGLYVIPKNNIINIISIPIEQLREYTKAAKIFRDSKFFVDEAYTVVYRRDIPYNHNEGVLPELVEGYVWIPIERFREGSYGASDMRTQILPDHYNKIKRLLNDIEALK